jgi:hypothetical protein
MFVSAKNRFDCDDGSIIVEYTNGTKIWWLNRRQHRLDGPAIERKDGSKEWFINGKRHRLDGPAIIWSDGTKEWWIEGIQYSEKIFLEAIITFLLNCNKETAIILKEMLHEKDIT